MTDWSCSCGHCMGTAEPPWQGPCLAPSPNGILRCGEFEDHSGPHGNWWAA